MFNNCAVLIQAKDVNPGPVVIAGPLLETMQHDVVVLGNDALEVNTFSGVLLCHPGEVLDERLFAICYRRIVLKVHITCVPFDGFGRLALVEHQIVEGRHSSSQGHSSSRGVALLCG